MEGSVGGLASTIWLMLTSLSAATSPYYERRDEAYCEFHLRITLSFFLLLFAVFWNDRVCCGSRALYTFRK
ncbi:hypothetical protein B0H19DRAFT_1145061 [Mycena capillaripes]|nr:hypothetical protein B0H19DRAFT_1145061 [Mycena capillaripes]